MQTPEQTTSPALRPEPCSRCEKPPTLCVCQAIPQLAVRRHVLILQHPQEPDKMLGSAKLAALSLGENASLKVGLSWPNITKALGRETQPSRWAVLYLGSGIKAAQDPASAARIKQPGLHLTTKNGVPLKPEEEARALKELEGIIILDGTWSQAKTLWWRNAWLLKCKRAILIPRAKSLYGELRKEPRRECLSTIETIAESLDALGEPAATGESLRALFAALLKKFRENHSNRQTGKPAN